MATRSESLPYDFQHNNIHFKISSIFSEPALISTDQPLGRANTCESEAILEILVASLMTMNTTRESRHEKLGRIIDDLDEYQLRKAVHQLALIHPDIVETAITTAKTHLSPGWMTARSYSPFVKQPLRIFGGEEDSEDAPQLSPKAVTQSRYETNELQSPVSQVPIPQSNSRQDYYYTSQSTSPDTQARHGSKLEVVESQCSQPPRPSPPAKIPVVEPSGDTIACYLVYESGSSGKLILHYSKTILDHAIGKWVPGNGKRIQGFKVTQNSGRSDLIGNCAGGVTGRKNYFSGWCQFIRAAKALNGSVTLLEPTGVGLPVDVYVYFHDKSQTVKLLSGTPVDVSNIVAVACLPKHTAFYSNSMTIDMMKWLGEAMNIGAASMM